MEMSAIYTMKPSFFLEQHPKSMKIGIVSKANP